LCRSIAAACGGLYIDPNTTAGLVSPDLHDITHLVQPGRAKWCRALAQALAPVVSAATPTPSPSGSPSLSAN
ncbi:MAG TPA: hypothetical protein VK576_08475, partial [Thermoleophilia bacterium]|nr:hypothetical protein [Thermoleophilia bacterium]